MITKEHLQTLLSRRDQLHKFLNISNKKTDADALEKTTQSIDFWESPKEAQIIIKKINSLKIWLNAYTLVENNIDELQILLELDAEESEIKSQLKATIISLEDLEFKKLDTFFTSEFNAISENRVFSLESRISLISFNSFSDLIPSIKT